MDANIGEDSYGSNTSVSGRVVDTCNNDTTNSFTCSPSESKTCIDIYDPSNSWGTWFYSKRSVTCQQAKIPYKIIPPPVIRTCTATLVANDG